MKRDKQKVTVEYILQYYSCSTSIWGLTEPGLLVSLHLDGEAEVGQFHRCSFRLGGQQQVLWLQTQDTC